MEEILKLIQGRMKILDAAVAALVPEHTAGDTEARLYALTQQLDRLSAFCSAAINLSKLWSDILEG